MKFNKLTFSTLCSVALMPMLASATDYYYTASSNLVWSNSSYGGWSVKDGDGAFVSAENPPSLNDTLYFNPANYTSNRLYLDSNDSYYAKDIYITNSTAAETIICWDTKTAETSTTFDVSGKIYVTGTTNSNKDFQFIYADSSIGENGAPNLDITLGGIWMSANGEASANVDGANKARLTFGSSAKRINSLTVNGNIDLYSYSILSTYANSVKVTGVVSFYAKNWENNGRWVMACVAGKDIRYEIGGLSAGGQYAAVMGSSDIETASNTIVFKNAAGESYAYHGKIADSSTYGSASYAHISKLNLEMDGEGKQVITMQDMDNCYFTGTVTVKKGTLEICNSKSAGDLYLNGGVFGVANKSSTNKFITTGVHWKDGMLDLDVCSGKDSLVVEGAFERDANANGKLMFDIDITADDFAKLDNGELESIAYNLLTAESIKGFSDLDSELGIYGLDSKYDASFLFSDNILSTTITLATVPEIPSVALLVSMLALGFSIYRKRK